MSIWGQEVSTLLTLAHIYQVVDIQPVLMELRQQLAEARAREAEVRKDISLKTAELQQVQSTLIDTQGQLGALQQQDSEAQQHKYQSLMAELNESRLQVAPYFLICSR